MRREQFLPTSGPGNVRKLPGRGNTVNVIYKVNGVKIHKYVSEH